jgi:hypothetical protein
MFSNVVASATLTLLGGITRGLLWAGDFIPNGGYAMLLLRRSSAARVTRCRARAYVSCSSASRRLEITQVMTDALNVRFVTGRQVRDASSAG